MIQNPIVTCDMCRTNSFVPDVNEYNRLHFEQRRHWTERFVGGKHYDICPIAGCQDRFAKQCKEAEKTK